MSRAEAGAETAIQLLEYANSQLLEFRHELSARPRLCADRVGDPRTD